MKAILFDTETTGLTLPSAAPLAAQPKIIELGAIVVERTKDGHRVISENNWLINPGEPISAEITKITGITNEQLADKPTFAQLLPNIELVFGQCQYAVAHNAPFDMMMMGNELLRLNKADFPWPENIICSVQEYYHLFGFRPTLKVLYERMVGKPLAQTHRALDDCQALLECLVADKFFDMLEPD